MAMTDRLTVGTGAALERYAALGDEEIAARVRGGELPLFELLMRRYNQRLYRVARAIVKNDSEAEDVTQQAYVNAYVNLHQFEGRAKFSTWLTRIAVHEALSRARRQSRIAWPGDDTEEDPMERIASPAVDPERQAFAGELGALLERAVDELPETYRAVFVMRDVEGLSTSETAECLELTEEAVKTRLHRAKAMLRDRLYDRAGLAAPTAFSFHLSRCDRIVAAVFAQIRGMEKTE
jgi:RNA polymerase sigma-70 factor (ECF subfamily)